METESENLNQKKESFKKTLDDMLHEVETRKSF
jgi:hypothetical protein